MDHVPADHSRSGRTNLLPLLLINHGVAQVLPLCSFSNCGLANEGSHVCKGWSFDISLTWFERVSLGMAVCQVLRALVILDRKYSYPKLAFEGMPKSALFARKHNFKLLIAGFRFNKGLSVVNLIS